MNPIIPMVSQPFQNPQLAGLFFDALLRGSIALLLAAVVCVFWRRASAATRHGIWLLAVLSLPCLPLLSSLLPSWQKPLWSLTTRFDSGNQVSLALTLVPKPIIETLGPAGGKASTITGSLAAAPAGSGQWTLHFNPNWLAVMLAVWAAGFVIVCARVIAGQFQLQKIARRSRRVDDGAWTALLDEARAVLGISRPVALLQSAQNVMPVTWGNRRPMVLLPAEAAQWPAARRRVVLMHELAHVKRWDCLTQWMASVVCAGFWCNPLVWFAARRLRIEQERACDDLVLAGGCRASEYAGHLVEIARTFRRVPQVAGIAMARPSGLEQRVVAILDGGRNRRRLARRVILLIAFTFLGLGWLAGGYARDNAVETKAHRSPAIEAQLKAFVAEKETQARASTNDVSVFQPFFAAAEQGHWLAISNAFEDLRSHAGQYEHSAKTAIDDRLHGTAWQAVIEIWGAFDGFGEGDEKYSALFGRDIIQSIPPGSVYFGGTDPGRFLVTAMCQSQVNADPFFVLTQNALADSSYLDYLRSMYGGKIYIPTAADSQKCFEDYIQDAQRRYEQHQLKPGEDVKVDKETGRVQVSGQVAVMQINGMLVRTIFDKTPDREFYVEESFPLDWMYPYLEPHGLIMKLNRQPLPQLPAEVIRADHDYWTRQVTPMIGDWLQDGTSVSDIARFAEKVQVNHDLSGFKGDPRFVQNDYACKMYSKLRSSIAGVYVWRAQHATDAAEKKQMVREADFAFRQAWALCPYSPEAVYRYVNFLLEQNRHADALLVAETASRMPSLQGADGSQIRDLVVQLKRAAFRVNPTNPTMYAGGVTITKPPAFQVRPVEDAPADDTEAMTTVGSSRQAVSPPETLNVQKTALLDQAAVQSAEVIHGQLGEPKIQITLTEAGQKQFAEVTRQHLHQRLAIVLDGRLYSAPIIQSEITGGKAEISGSFGESEAQALVAKINAATGHLSGSPVLQFRLVSDVPGADTEPLTRVASNPPPDQPRPETLNVRKTILLDQAGVQSATATRDALGRPQIEITLTDNGRKQFAEITRRYLHQRLALILDGRLYSAPVVQSEISDGKVQVTGNFSEPEVQDLVAQINRSLAQ